MNRWSIGHFRKANVFCKVIMIGGASIQVSKPRSVLSIVWLCCASNGVYWYLQRMLEGEQENMGGRYTSLSVLQ